MRHDLAHLLLALSACLFVIACDEDPQPGADDATAVDDDATAGADTGARDTAPDAAPDRADTSTVDADAATADASDAADDTLDPDAADTEAGDTAAPADLDTDADAPDVAQPPTVPDPTCETPGCVRALTLLGDFERASIEPLLEPGVTIDTGYSVFAMEFVTTTADGVTATSTGTVAIPFPATPPADGFAIVANAHGTVGLEDRCSYAGTVYGAGLAGLFAARGAIGVAPDYPGLGTPGVHPYLASRVEGAAVLDSLRAAAAIARSRAVPIAERYGVVGLSQGGHATLATAALHATYAPELDIRAFAAAAPASAWLEQWTPGLGFDGPHLVYHALLVYAWNAFYGDLGGDLWAPAFAAEVDAIMSERCIFDLDGATPVFADAIPTQPSAVFSAELIAAWTGGQLDTVYPGLAAAFAANRIVPWVETAPLAIWQGDADSTVLEADTAALVATLRGAGMTVDYRVVPGGEHIDVAFGFVAQNQLRTAESIAWVLDLANAP